MEKLMNKNFFSKKFFHEIPGGTSRDIHGTFLDLELPKLSVGTFYSGKLSLKSKKKFSTKIIFILTMPSFDFYSYFGKYLFFELLVKMR